MKTSKKDFLQSVQSNLNSYLSIPKKNKGLENKNNHHHSTSNEIKTPLSVKTNSTDTQEIESIKSINLINKLHDTLHSLEKKHNSQVAKKYLTGFLEEKGFFSFTSFIKSLT